MSKLKWSKAELKYFSKPILIAEYDYGRVGWILLAICSLAGLGYLWMGVMK